MTDTPGPIQTVARLNTVISKVVSCLQDNEVDSVGIHRLKPFHEKCGFFLYWLWIG